LSSSCLPRPKLTCTDAAQSERRGHHDGVSLYGDVLGALTKGLGFAGTQIGKINVKEFSTYLALEAGIANEALRRLASGKVKGRV
jgi:uncharacterized protein YcfJ